MSIEAGLHWFDTLTLASGSSISVDGTALVLVAIFVALMIYLNRVLYRPYLHIKDLRNERIAGVSAAAEATAVRADELLARYQEQLAQARSEALELKVSIRQSAKRDQSEMIEKAHGEAETALSSAREDLAEGLRQTQTQLEAQAVSLSAVIVNRVLPS